MLYHHHLLLVATAIAVHSKKCRIQYTGVEQEMKLAAYREIGLPVSMWLKIASSKPLQTLPFDQRSLLRSFFLESVLLLLCHVLAFISFSSAYLISEFVALTPRTQ